MKKLIFASVLLLASFFATSHALAWDDCPRGEVNDPAPGDCSLYVDTDNNGICDHSEPAPEDRAVASNQTTTYTPPQSASEVQNYETEKLPELSGKDLKTKTVSEVADFYEIDQNKFELALEDYLKVGVKSSDTFQLLHDNYGAEPSIVKELVLSVRNGTTPNFETDSNDANTSNKKIEKNYFLGPISIGLILIYLISFALSKIKIISVINHRKVWNMMLLVTFLVSAVLGILLTIRISSGINIALPFNMLFWHVEAGIAMTLISIFHILWHLPYFKNILRTTKPRSQAQ